MLHPLPFTTFGDIAALGLKAMVRGGSVCLNSFPGFLSGASAGVISFAPARTPYVRPVS